MCRWKIKDVIRTVTKNTPRRSSCKSAATCSSVCWLPANSHVLVQLFFINIVNVWPHLMHGHEPFETLHKWPSPPHPRVYFLFFTVAFHNTYGLVRPLARSQRHSRTPSLCVAFWGSLIADGIKACAFKFQQTCFQRGNRGNSFNVYIFSLGFLKMKKKMVHKICICDRRCQNDKYYLLLILNNLPFLWPLETPENICDCLW